MKDNAVKNDNFTEEELALIEYYSNPESQRRNLEIAHIKDVGAEILK